MSRERLLAAGVAWFEETGEWPKIDWVQRTLVRWWDDTNAGREAERLPNSLGGVRDGRLWLGVRAFYQRDPNSRLLEAFRIALREAWTKYRDGHPPAEVLLSESDLRNRASLSQAEAKQALELLEVEGLLEKKTERVWRVVPAVRHYKAARSIEDYLDRKRQFERRHCLRGVRSKASGTFRRSLRPGGWVGALFVATLAILLAALALWLGREVFGPASTASRAPAHQARSGPSSKAEGNRAGPPPPAPAGRR